MIHNLRAPLLIFREVDVGFEGGRQKVPVFAHRRFNQTFRYNLAVFVNRCVDFLLGLAW